MLQKFKLGLLCAGLLFSTSCLATNYNLIPGIRVDYDIPPNKPLEFTNVWFWSITATCVTTTEDNSDDVLIEELSKTGKINGHIITQGESLHLVVHTGDKLEISADSGAKVRLTNEGEHKLHVSCSV